MAEVRHGYSAHDFAKGISLPYSHYGTLVRNGYLELIKYACDL